MNVLGISCYYHDSAAALVQDGRVIAAAEEERLSRVKHDRTFPQRAVDFCLRRGGITAKDVDYAVFYERPLAKFERILTAAIGTFPKSREFFAEAMIGWIQEKLWIKSKLMSALGIPAERVLFVDHHVSHAASAFFCSPFRRAALLTVDGVGEWSTATWGSGEADWEGAGKNSIVLRREMRFPHSLGLLYSAFTAFLGFEVNEGEYKVMGMAPYGEPRYVDRVEKMARVANDGSIEIDLSYFRFHDSIRIPYSSKFLSVFGEPRQAESEFFVSAEGHSEEEAKRNRYYADVAASIQRFTEDALLRMVASLHRETGEENLCIAGGVALNSSANGRIVRESPFKSVFIQPAAGDSGGALGAALYCWHVLLGKRRRFVMEDAYLGEDYGAEIPSFVRSQNLRAQTFTDDEKLIAAVTDELLAGKVVGWFQGRFEWGPRALGNRSILADPRRAEMKDIVNSKIKFREPFRPFAPVVPEDEAAKYFEAGKPQIEQYPARYMLLVYPWRREAGEQLPAVNHMGTGRLQTTRREWNSRYDGLVRTFGQASGIPVLMNTSFNLRGEAMVASPSDAWSTFQRSGLDVLVLGDCVIKK